MYFDRFDIVEAYYLFFTYYHTGQWSKEYQRLSKMQKYFHPSPNLSFSALSDNALDIYYNLERKVLNTTPIFTGDM